MIIQGGTTTDLPAEVVAAYEAPFPSPESKAGAARFPLLVPLTANDPGAAEMRAVRDALAGWGKPALVAFSDTDPVFPYPIAGEQFTKLIPTSASRCGSRARPTSCRRTAARRSPMRCSSHSHTRRHDAVEPVNAPGRTSHLRPGD